MAIRWSNGRERNRDEEEAKVKIYVASSRRNEGQQAIVAQLRSAGHEVYDFKNPGEGKTGFSWKKTMDALPPWGAYTTRIVLASNAANEGFKLDMDALKWCDACVMVQPCGVSAALELGWACGAKKITVALLEDNQEPEHKLKMADKICISIDEVIEYLASAPALALGPNQKRYDIASQPHATMGDAEEAVRAFYAEVSVSREKHKIPEVIIVVGMSVTSLQSDTSIAVDVCSFGDPRVAPVLGSVAWREFTAPTIKRAEKLKKLAGKEES
jgi:hypothetical protein